MSGRRGPTPAPQPPEQFGYRAVLEASPNAILAVDANSIITFANPVSGNDLINAIRAGMKRVRTAA